MDNNKPILTVAIPAYNRVEPLENIIKQFQQEDQTIFKLLIMDDTSPTDLTPMVSKYLKTMPNLIFERNKENLGFSGNVCKLYDKADTPFIWFLCDDDTIIPGCVTKIVESLKRHDPTAAVFNYSWDDPYGRRLNAGVDKDVIYNSESEVSDYGALVRMTFLSILVLKRVKPSDEVKMADYKSNVFVQITLALMLLSEKFKFVEIAVPVLHRNVGYKYGEFFKFYIVDEIRAMFAIDHKLDNKKFLEWERKKIPGAFLLYMSQKLGLFKYRGVMTKRTIREIIRYYGIYSVFIFLFVPIYFIVPAFLLKLIYKIQLYRLHGAEKGQQIYNENIDRAYKDKRQTGFTKYR